MKHRIIFIAMLLFVVIPSVWADDDDMLTTPLTLEAISDGTITFKNAATYSVNYRINDGEELQTDKRSGNNARYTYIQVKAGDKVTFVSPAGSNWLGGANSSYTHQYKENYQTKYSNSNISCSSDCYIYGNIMSLLTPTFETALTTKAEYSWCSYNFYMLFANNPHLLSHSTKDLVMPAMELTSNSYRMMFSGCKGLTRAPALPATKLGYQCYYQMFINCTGLTETPVLPATSLDYQSYHAMFSGCTNLSRVTCYANPNSSYMTDWLKGTAAEGTFVKAAGSTWTVGTNGIPAGWTVVEKIVPYAYYDADSKTLYFRCDANRPTSNASPVENTGPFDPGWYGKRENIESIVFEESFQEARPVSCYRWFYGMNKVTSVTGWENFNTSEVTTMQNMFYGISDSFPLDFSHFDTGKVTNMSNMFLGSKKTSIDMSGLNTSKVKSMGSMFRGCTNLTSLDLSTFDTGNVISISEMFYECYNLKSVNLTSFNTSKVTSLYGVFYKCSALESVDLRSFDTSNVTDVTWMFMNCSSLKALDLSSFDTGKVTNFYGMFQGCSGLTILDLTNFHTVGTPIYSYMFSNCTNLKTILVDDKVWSIAPQINTNNMFDYCYSLVGEDGTHVSPVTSTDGTHAHTGPGGYFTKKYRDITAKAAKGSYWTTYYNGNVSRIADGNTTVYTVSLNGNKLSLHEVADRNIKAGQGVLLKSSQESITLANSIYEPTADYTTNSLKGTDTEISNPNVGNTYVFSYKPSTDKLGFYKLSSTATIGASKAYLVYEGGSANYLSWEDETTDIEGISIDKTADDAQGTWYDLSGRRIVGKPAQKGIYIKNGKKVAVR